MYTDYPSPQCVSKENAEKLNSITFTIAFSQNDVYDHVRIE